MRDIQTGETGVIVEISPDGWRIILCGNDEELKRRPNSFRLADGAPPAEVVAKAMNGYLLYSKILECRVLKPEEVRPKTFHLSKANLQLVNRPVDQLRNSARR